MADEFKKKQFVPPNLHRIKYGVYIVRSKSGFRRAVEDYGVVMEDTGSIEGAPPSYPSLVSLYVTPENNEAVVCRAVHLKTLYSALEYADPLFCNQFKVAEK